MLTIGVLASTRGTDLDAVVSAIKKGSLNAKAQISVVISNRKDAGVMERARKHGLTALFVDPAALEREQYDKKLHSVLRKHKVQLILLIGYMRILSPWFVERWRNCVMNIHPSLLPAFAVGLDTDVHAAVLERGCKVTGCTLHFVDEGADTGPIIIQRVIPVEGSDDVDTLKQKVQAEEGKAIVDGIALFEAGRLKVKDNRVFIM